MNEQLKKQFKHVAEQISSDDVSSLKYDLFWLKNHFIDDDEISYLFDVLYRKCVRQENESDD